MPRTRAPLSRLRRSPPTNGGGSRKQPGIVFGYGNLSRNELERGAATIAEAYLETPGAEAQIPDAPRHIP